jgi:uncharacterized protein YndB with AHSA1/START domain
MINTSKDRLYKAVTQPTDLSHWWTVGARGDNTLGGRLEFWFDDFCASVAEIRLLAPGQRASWHVIGGGAGDWIGTDIDFSIFEEQGNTLLHFRHSNWQDDARAFPHCSLGWAIFLLSLKEYAETGKGRPYPYDLPINMWKPPIDGSH